MRQDPVHRLVDRRLGVQRLVEVGVESPWAASPRPPSDGLDRLYRDVALPAQRNQCREVGCVAGFLHQGVVIWQQDRIQVKPLQAAPVHRRGLEPVTRHTQETHQSLLPRLDKGLQRPSRPHGLFPGCRAGQVVHLPEVHVVDAQALQRMPQIIPRPAVRAPVGLGSEEESVPVLLHPRPDALLGVSVHRCDVDMVDAVCEQELEDTIGLRRLRLAQGICAEDQARAGMSGTSESLLRYHLSLPPGDSAHGLFAWRPGHRTSSR